MGRHALIRHVQTLQTPIKQTMHAKPTSTSAPWLIPALDVSFELTLVHCLRLRANVSSTVMVTPATGEQISANNEIALQPPTT